LKAVGRIAHVAKSGRVIVELASPVRDGAVLHDRRGTRLARVMETIGPVARPFASASPLTNNIGPHVGGDIFAPDDERAARAPTRGAAGAGGARRAARGPRGPGRRAGQKPGTGSGRRAPARRAPSSRGPGPSDGQRPPRRSAGGARRAARGPRGPDRRAAARKEPARRADAGRRPRHGGRRR